MLKCIPIFLIGFCLSLSSLQANENNYPLIKTRISLQFQNLDIRSALELLFDLPGVNLNLVLLDNWAEDDLTEETFTRKISFYLKNLPWDEALNVLLEAVELEMRQSGNVVYVGKTTAIEQIAVADKIYEGKLISVHFQDIEANSALWIIAELVGQFNVIVLEENSTEKFSLRLKNVPWDGLLNLS